MRTSMVGIFVIAAIGIGPGEAWAKTKRGKVTPSSIHFTKTFDKSSPTMMRSKTAPKTPSPAGPLPIPYPNVVGQGSGPAGASAIRGTNAPSVGRVAPAAKTR
jgi:hypothetical protein